MASFTIVVLPGDGIGPEVTVQAVRVLGAVGERFGHAFTFETHAIGGAAVDASKDPLPPATLDACRSCHAILLGAVGGPKWDGVDPAIRPEKGLLRIRGELGLFANLRPTVVHERLIDRSPLRPEIARGTDVTIVRELTGGIYFGEKTEGDEEAIDRCTYSGAEVERIARLAGTIARGRRGRVCSVDKANVLATSRLWRRTVERLFAEEFPDVELEHALVDSTAMRLVSHPAHFDVMLTENMFGDILSDQAAALTGTLGLAPSASMGASRPGLFEPVHGSAPDIAGLGKANPYATILSAAMLLRDGLGLADEAAAVEAAVAECLDAGLLTPDLDPASKHTTGAIGAAVIERVRAASLA
ncbi:MAG: 3-isopropylmalate dehydrogenase [Planctomycetota bacterium]